MSVDVHDWRRILKSHPSLLEQVSGGGLRLTLEGRLFVLVLLQHEDYINQAKFKAIVDSETDGQHIYIKTAKMVADAATEWIARHGEDLEKRAEEIYQGTDLNTRAVGMLMWVLTASQQNFAASLISGR